MTLRQTDCEFNEARHEYRIEGRVVVNWSRVAADLLPGWQASQWYLERGKEVHKAAACIARREEFDFDPVIEGQVRALQRFFREVQPVVVEVEKCVYSVRHQCAGTFDLLTRKPTNSLAPMMLDFKATLTKSVPYQCAFYAMAREEMGGTQPINLGVGVEIRDDGTYSMSEIWDLRRYKAGALALLGAWNVRRECGIKERDAE